MCVCVCVSIEKVKYLFTQPLRREQDTTQGQFLSRVCWFEFKGIYPLWLKNVVCPTIYPISFFLSFFLLPTSFLSPPLSLSFSLSLLLSLVLSLSRSLPLSLSLLFLFLLLLLLLLIIIFYAMQVFHYSLSDSKSSQGLCSVFLPILTILLSDSSQSFLQIPTVHVPFPIISEPFQVH